MCQTHRRQVLTTGKTRPIRPYRERMEGTEKFAGLRLSQGCAQALRRRAERARMSHGALISFILEEWYEAGAAFRRVDESEEEEDPPEDDNE